jgi:DNA-binding LytR/AlgR family response regulator
MSNKVSCIITDDEPFARKGLQGYVEKIDFLDLKETCEDALHLSNILQQQPVDLLFLDIQMPYITGVEFLQAIRNPPKVILTTAYEQYAIQGFELDVLDYLLKPISYERFLKAAWKAKDYFSLKEQPGNTVPYLFVKANGRLEKITFEDILYIEGMENYVAIYLENRKIITHTTIKSLLEKLPAKQFIQSHKSYVVAIDKVNTIEGNTLHIQKHQVPVSKYLREEVLGRIVK